MSGSINMILTCLSYTSIKFLKNLRIKNKTNEEKLARKKSQFSRRTQTRL